MNDDVQLNDGEELASIDDLTSLAQTGSDSTPTDTGTPDLPEKYRGKSMDEIVKMHQEAERLVGRQGAELGELRRLTDDVIKRSFSTQPSPATTPTTTPEVDELDFITNPTEAISKLVEQHPKIREMEAQREVERRQSNLAQLESKHPDYRELVGDEKFQEWVTGSKVRTVLFAKANADYDFDAANELFETYKALHPKADTTTTPPKQSTGQTLPRGRTTSADTGFNSSKKVWSRAEIIRLHQTDPRRYEELQPEIMQAYAEKRVR